MGMTEREATYTHAIKAPYVLMNRRGDHKNGKTYNIKKKAEPKGDFGLPEERKYPMPDAAHARNAKARASQMERQGKLTGSDKKKIDAKADRILKKK
jgi:hypothetical protein